MGCATSKHTQAAIAESMATTTSRTPAPWRGSSSADMCMSCRSRAIGQGECALGSRLGCTCLSSVSASTGSDFYAHSERAINASCGPTPSPLAGVSAARPATPLSPSHMAPEGVGTGVHGTTSSINSAMRLGWGGELERNYGDSDSNGDEQKLSPHATRGDGGDSPALTAAAHRDSHSIRAVIEPAASRANTAGVLARDFTASVLGSGSYGTRGMSSLWSRMSLDSVDDAASITGCRPPSPAAAIGRKGDTAATSPVSITAMRPSRRANAQHRVAGQRFDVDSVTREIVVDMLEV